MSIGSRILAAVNILIGKDPIANQTPDQVPFGPLQPLAPSYQEEMKGRQFDYLTGYNLLYQPRVEEPNTFKMLRQFADSYDLLRLAIETRKDQMCRMNWNIRYKDKTKDPDDACKAAEELFQYPDGEHDWGTWLRMILEDMFVIDASTIYPRVTKGGQLLCLDTIDGALISRKLDASGRTPKPPSVAYQQIIKGLPAVDYCQLDLSPKPIAIPGSELIYAVRNPRTWKAYGLSHVEQIILTINVGLRRQLHKLQYYTEGSLPDSLIPCPPDWTADQVAHMQELFDTLLSGNTAERRKARFIPGGTGLKPFDIKEQALKDEFDEWLARVICFCFSLPPTAFIRQNNRATADSAKAQAEEEGNAGTMLWVKGIMDMVICRYISRDMELAWDAQADIDPLVQAQVDQIYLQEYVVSPAEVRENRGMKGPPPDKPLLPEFGAPADGSDPANPSKPGGAVPGKKQQGASPQRVMAPSFQRAKKQVELIDRNRKAIQAAEKSLRKTLVSFLDKEAHRLAKEVSAAYKELVRAVGPQDIVAQLNLKGWAVLIDPVAEELEEIYADGTVEAFAQISFAATDKLTSLMSERAWAYAQSRAAELVGMKNTGSEEFPHYVENPNAEWAITDTTRDKLNELVTDAMENGHSPGELKQAIIDSEAFSPARAEMIARTELAFADVAGNMDAYRHSGVVTGKEWILGSEHDLDDDCDQNVEDGVIGLDDSFSSGDDAPPAHPNCICDILPVLMEAEDE